MPKGLPNHIAIIPDGNRRWAKEKGLPSIEGHRRGADVAIEISKVIRKMGIHTLTLWAFSTENWDRPDDEIKYLMTLYESYFDRLVKDALKDSVKIVHLGRKDRISQKLAQKIVEIEEKTAQYTNYAFNIALDYGGRNEVIRAIHKAAKTSDHTVLTEENFSSFLDTANQKYPNPDIIIRTSGEQRTSGFMIYQAVYAEYFFLEKYFPELNKQDIETVVTQYTSRQRRFGK